ncbi:MAG: type I methionyl aminopeptidase [Phototrophicaceae bacterium]
MIVQGDKDIQGLQRIGEICGEALKHMFEHVEVGMTTKELDRIGEAFLKQHNATSAPITAYKYPGWTCISLNEQAAHGIPGKRVINEGDILNVDVSAVLEGYWGDTGASMIVGEGKKRHHDLLRDTRAALYAGIGQANADAPINAIGKAVEKLAKKGKYRIIKQLSGHGVGRHIHEAPNIPNYFVRQAKQPLVDGLVFTIEPFFNLGRGIIVEDKDGWTLRTPDRSLSAQFEHTIIVNGDDPIIITKVEGGH